MTMVKRKQQIRVYKNAASKKYHNARVTLVKLKTETNENAYELQFVRFVGKENAKTPASKMFYRLGARGTAILLSEDGMQALMELFIKTHGLPFQPNPCYKQENKENDTADK